jgi:hypothetical protein
MKKIPISGTILIAIMFTCTGGLLAQSPETRPSGIGEDSGSPVDFTYAPPFRFNGNIEKVTVELK